LSLRLIVSLIIGITLVSLGFSYFEVVGEKRVLRSDLEKRAEVLGESVASSIEKSSEPGSERGLQRLVQRFGNREHLLGIAIYDRQGAPVVMSAGLKDVLTGTPHEVIQAMQEDREESSFTHLGNGPVHVLTLPLHRQDEVVGGLVVVDDALYIRTQTLRAWRQAFLRVLAQVFLIVLITLLIVRWSITGPIA